jgi:hypothetical protein
VLKNARLAATASLESPPVTPKLRYPSDEKSKLCFFPFGFSPEHLTLLPSSVTLILHEHTGHLNIELMISFIMPSYATRFLLFYYISAEKSIDFEKIPVFAIKATLPSGLFVKIDVVYHVELEPEGASLS